MLSIGCLRIFVDTSAHSILFKWCGRTQILNLCSYDFIIQVLFLHKPRKRDQSGEELKASPERESSSPHPDTGHLGP